MTGAHREIERKFRVTGGFTLPDLASLPGVASTEALPAFSMTNEYYDTADLRLFRWDDDLIGIICIGQPREVIGSLNRIS